MKIQIKSIMKGTHFDVCSLVIDGKDDVNAFLDELMVTRQKEYDKVTTQLEFIANHKSTFDEQRMRKLQGTDSLFEIKTRGGSRIIAFYDRGSLIICTTAFQKPKGKRLRKLIHLSEDRKRRYFEMFGDRHD